MVEIIGILGAAIFGLLGLIFKLNSDKKQAEKKAENSEKRAEKTREIQAAGNQERAATNEKLEELENKPAGERPSGDLPRY